MSSLASIQISSLGETIVPTAYLVETPLGLSYDSHVKMLIWIAENFGVMIVFQGVNYFYGLKPAIISSLLLAAGEFLALKLKKRKLTTFMKFSFAMILAFGMLDLFLDSSVFFKFEGAIMNLIIAGYFGLSLFKEKSLLELLAEQQGRIEMESYPDKTFFFNFMTSVWFLYFLFKATVYFWIAHNNSTEKSFILRTVFGTASFYILLGITLGLSKQTWNMLLKLKLMPSTSVNPHMDEKVE